MKFSIRSQVVLNTFCHHRVLSTTVLNSSKRSWWLGVRARSSASILRPQYVSASSDDDVQRVKKEEIGLVQFMKRVLKDYENIRGKPASSIDFWDVVMITAADNDQRDVFKAQIDAKSKRGELPTGIPYTVISDPPGPKLGNGGSTFTALSHLYKEYKDDLFDLKILLIHAGGQSKRMPSTSVLGKIFSPIPYGNPIFQMLDFKLAMYMPFIPKMGPGVFVACADDMLVYNLGDLGRADWSFAENGFTVLGHPSTIEIGTKHGVYVVEDESKIDTMQHIQTLPCVEVLQKPSIERMKARKAILARADLKFPDGIKFDGSIAYTDSSFFFAMDVSKKLIEFYENHGPIDCEIDAYGDFLQALGPNSSIDYTKNISNVTIPTPSLIPTRQKVYNTLRDCAITLLAMNSSKFVHIGTTKEYIHHFCFDQVFQKELGLQKDVFNAWIEEADGGPAKKMKLSTISSGCVMHSAIPADLFVSENTVVEYCDFNVPLDIGQNSIISNCCVLKSNLPPKTTKVRIPHNVFLHTVPVKNAKGTQFATVAFHINDNLKKEIQAADFQKLPYLGYDVEDAVKYCHIDIATSKGQGDHHDNTDGKSIYSLWNLCVFPLEPNMTLSLLSALDLIRAIQKKDDTICNFSGKDLVSMETIIKKKDVMIMLDYREELHSKITGN
ncbi:hypothetical protein FSP39_019622 [Pinctada imbricata]|uniref:GDP-fucose pyrophosphorylase domain-containing protein n=1 Tax=Pinctada imbricata TaxID=66713 RepID=A0AA89BZS9_PINIB|nr:hypothetical protein FSP39_019622 [Pinctada imbricata]